MPTGIYDRHPPSRSPSHTQALRERIQTAKLLSKLEAHALENKPLSLSRIKAIEILLRKSLSDLQTTDLNVQGALTVVRKFFGAQLAKQEAQPDAVRRDPE
jgi:hypothetical protein